MRWWRRTLGRVGPRELAGSVDWQSAEESRQLERRVQEMREATPKARACPDGAPLPAGLRFRWKGLAGEVYEIVVLPGDGRGYRATMDGRGTVEGTATLERLRAWYDARE